jgi:hypothetical protein
VLRKSNRSVAPRRTMTKSRISFDIRSAPPFRAVPPHRARLLGRTGYRCATFSRQLGLPRTHSRSPPLRSSDARPAELGGVRSEQPLCQ